MKQTINEIEVNGIKYIPKDSANVEKLATDINGLKAVLVRGKYAGVHFGYLKKEEFTLSGKVVTLLNTRRVWYWDGAASLSQMALEGVSKPQNCKFSVQIESNEIVEVVETIPLTEKALRNLYNVKEWKQ
jgi:hypothetical protein